MTRLWGGRFSGDPAPELLAFTESLSFDRALARDDCAVLAAHCRALARAGLLSHDEAARASDALEHIGVEIARGAVVPEPSDEDVHTMVERMLVARLPDVAPKTRAGLSRNDRVSAALRRWLLREGGAVLLAVGDVIEALAVRAREHAETLMPGYTHLQRAQPVTLGHHLLAHAFAFERDATRLYNALAGADASPLGAGALAGSTLGLDAGETADDLGFTDVIPNSIDAVSARDFVAEFLAAAAILGVHCSRLGEEIVLWTSAEFSFATLDDAFATGSSLMPQKKNPDIAELARGKAGRLVGNLTGLLVTLKGLPFAYDRDLQEDKEPLFDSVRTLRLMLPAITGLLRTLRFDEDVLAASAADPSLIATDAAEDLVRDGVPFRDAHEAIGRRVAAGEHGDSDVGAARASVQRRGAPGPARPSIDEQLKRIDAALDAIRRAER